MRNNLSRTLKMVPRVVALALLSATFPAMTDDTEIYKAEYDVGADGGQRAKILIVFDDSGSMSTLVEEIREDYDPAATYVETVSADRIYWSTDGSVPSSGTSRWFTDSSNRCDASFDTLANEGRFGVDEALRWEDSTVIAGQCSNVCPDGTTLRNPPGPNNTGCYREDLVENAVPKLVYYSNDSGNRCYGGSSLVEFSNGSDSCYIEVITDDPEDGFIYRQNDSGNSCPSGLTYLEVNPPGRNNTYDACFEFQEEPEFVEELEWVFDSDPVLECEDDTPVPGSWESLDSDENTPTHVDCLADVTANNDGNGPGEGSGFPKNNVVNGEEYSADVDNTINWGGTSYTFFTSHYMNWYYDNSILTTRDRLDVAQSVVSTIIETNPNIDFGLMEFNRSEGGRIAQRIIQDMSADDRTNLVSLVNQTEHAGSTPLCESMYEAYSYIAGGDVVYANDTDDGTNSSGDKYDALAKDPLAETLPLADSGSVYNSPNSDCAVTWIILMTDGFPFRDTSANQAIKDLTGETCDNYLDNNGDMVENCLPQLTEYMATTDLDGDSTNGAQIAHTITIGFQNSQQLLQDAAQTPDDVQGYYEANDDTELTAAFQGAIVGILSNTTTFTSPAVAVDTFTRTQSRDEVFYAMFEPESTVDWNGNIKKLRLDSNAILVDAGGVAALDSATGEIKTTARTFWSTGQDGPAVTQGGVGALLAARDQATRSIYSNTGTNGALEALNTSNFTYDALGLADENELWSKLGASTEDAAFQQINWARGFDAYDPNDPTAARDWVLGDILHSQPLVVNYGALGSATIANPDLRLLVGSNSGLVHFFGNTDGQEDWAFFPKELVEILPQRRRNAVSNQNVYGMDLTPTSYVYDANQDGTLDASVGDKVWAYLGMRRGGKDYYALDVSNPDSPSFLWRIGKDMAAFGELGQTWSEPVVAKIPGYEVDGVYQPVLIFGAGYDDNKDLTTVGSPDSEGRGIFIVDAKTGALIWSVTPAANSATNLSEPGLLHSVPGGVTVLDSNADEIADRVYFGDTGGNLWRVDMIGNALPTPSQDTWQINQLAAVNGGTTVSDRRIFNAPDVVRIRLNGKAVDGVIFGTGDRTNPNATDVDNRIYMIRDKATAPYISDKPTSAECSGSDPDFYDFRCELPLDDDDLFDITSNVINDGTEAEITTATQDLQDANGWRYDLGYTGEKSLAKSVTINGRAFIPTFTPANVIQNINDCVPSSGTGLMYVFDIYNGERSVINLGSIIPDTPSLHFAVDGTIRFLLPPGAPPAKATGPGDLDCVGAVCGLGESLRVPYGNYWFQEGYE